MHVSAVAHDLLVLVAQVYVQVGVFVQMEVHVVQHDARDRVAWT